ncbi:MAG: aminoglycoside 6-adenylyltransferase, partial [Deltaproteobacteria bacterium]
SYRYTKSLPHSPPARPDFIEVVETFYYRAQWAAKKIARGELWVGKRCCDSTMKELLLTMIEWNVRAREGADYPIWHGGRFLERWAPKSVLEGLRGIFSRYDEEDVRRALFKTVDLFNSIAGETAERMNLPYPGDIHKEVRGLIEEIFSEEKKPVK